MISFQKKELGLIRRYPIIGGRRLSNYWWSIVIFLGGCSFLFTGISSFFNRNLLLVTPKIESVSTQSISNLPVAPLPKATFLLQKCIPTKVDQVNRALTYSMLEAVEGTALPQFRKPLASHRSMALRSFARPSLLPTRSRVDDIKGLIPKEDLLFTSSMSTISNPSRFLCVQSNPHRALESRTSNVETFSETLLPKALRGIFVNTLSFFSLLEDNQNVSFPPAEDAKQPLQESTCANIEDNPPKEESQCPLKVNEYTNLLEAKRYPYGVRTPSKPWEVEESLWIMEHCQRNTKQELYSVRVKSNGGNLLTTLISPLPTLEVNNFFKAIHIPMSTKGVACFLPACFAQDAQQIFDVNKKGLGESSTLRLASPFLPRRSTTALTSSMLEASSLGVSKKLEECIFLFGPTYKLDNERHIYILFEENTGGVNGIPILPFFPQGLVLSFYGFLGLCFSFHLWFTLFWKIGAGFNEINGNEKSVRIFRWGRPGRNRRIDIKYSNELIETIKIELIPNPVLFLCIKGKKKIPLTRVGEFIPLENLETQAAELTSLLQVPLEIEE